MVVITQRKLGTKIEAFSQEVTRVIVFISREIHGKDPPPHAPVPLGSIFSELFTFRASEKCGSWWPGLCPTGEYAEGRQWACLPAWALSASSCVGSSQRRTLGPCCMGIPSFIPGDERLLVNLLPPRIPAGHQLQRETGGEEEVDGGHLT